jgi:hypothetical protein
MKNDFICPKCDGHLLVGGNVVFTGAANNGKRGIILLSPLIGVYTKVFNPFFIIREGEEINFYCPLCHTNLAAFDIDKRLVRLIMIDENFEKHEIFFSGIEGEYCTYKVSEKKYEKFGTASENYDIYFRTRRV